MKKKIAVVISFLSMFFFSTETFALNTDTHETINLNIANSNNVFSLNQYLLENLEFSQGIGEVFKGSRVDSWIEIGGLYEDIPAWYLMYVRSLNHFHDPVSESGFKGDCRESSLCESSTRWALEPLGTQSSQTGNYSWYDVRDYYLQALTSADQDSRNNNFADTFRGLGQLMHLVQDASVPSHVRNDFHYLANYENYAQTYVNQNGVPTPTNSDYFVGTLSNIASLIDTNSYNGTNPEVTLSNSVGLSEYTNANFFSEDTIFSNFSYPSIGGTEVWKDASNNRKYLKKTEGVPVEHLAEVSYLYFYRLRYFPQYSEYLPLGLDEMVYFDYASHLLPRAVGHSTGLLNYFFRGEINMVNDPDISGQYIIENTANEYMNGTFTLYYDDIDGK